MNTLTPFIKTGNMKRRKWYVGIIRGDYRVQELRGKYEAFHDSKEPDHQAMGWKYTAVIGPFRTMRAALFTERFGQRNVHIQHVDDAERISKGLCYGNLITFTQ